MPISSDTHRILSRVLGPTAAQDVADSLSEAATDQTDLPEEVTIVRTVTLPSVAAQQTYTIPLGCYFKAVSSEVMVEVNQGGGWNELQFGVDFVCRHRTDQVPTVADMAFGVTLIEGSVPAGWQIKISWRDRRILTAPVLVAPVKIGDPYTSRWNQMSPTMHPDGVHVPILPGRCVEFWRLTPRSGGSPRPGGGGHDGRRWIPYYRAAVDQSEIRVSEFGANLPSKRKKFRVCYYNPVTGARSDLSNDIIIASGQNGLAGDWANGVQRRYAGSVWIE